MVQLDVRGEGRIRHQDQQGRYICYLQAVGLEDLLNEVETALVSFVIHGHCRGALFLSQVKRAVVW